ncbi:MAG: transcription termination/antitermination protein NusG [Patescibacteria group bacterium]
MEPGLHWYVVHTYSGHEQKVADALKQRLEAFGLKDQITDILVPTQEKIVIDAGKKKTIRERLFPGYVMVQMILTNETWGAVRNTTGVTGFVGAGAKPTPLPPHEVDAILKFTKLSAPKFELKFSVGETVKVIDGPFTDFLGKVDEIDEEKGKVKVLVSVFGRETPIELDFLQVSRL